MAAPLAFDFGAEFQDVFEAADVELGVFGKAAGVRDADVVVFGCDFRREMILGGEEIDDLLLVGRVQKPALRFDAGGKKRDEQIAMILGPGALGEDARSLIRADELLDGAEAYEAFFLGDQRDWRPEHGAGGIFLLAHGDQALWGGAERFYFVILAGGQTV